MKIDASYLENRISRLPWSGCWIWMNYCMSDGYGSLRTSRHGMDLAHRVSYGIYRGEIPSGMCVLHRCDIPSCINPDHLWLGTHLDNMRDKTSKGRCFSPIADGEKNNAAKITLKQAREIIKDERTHSEIAGEYGISRSNVTRIKLRRSWITA